MWTEIKLSDLVADSTDTRRLLKRFIDAQAMMNKHYENRYTKENLREMLEKKSDLDMRLYFYDDGETEATMALKKNNAGELRLLTTACSKGDVNAAADIVQAALIKAIQRLGLSEAYALWSADNYEAGNTYFWAFVERCKTNFRESENTEYKKGNYKLVMKL